MQARKFEIFIKLMNMTSSDQDREALTALRKANGILMEANLNFEDLLRSKVTIQGGSIDNGKPPTGAIYENAHEINTMFEGVMKASSVRGSFKEFIESIHEWWEKKGFLTEKQYKALVKTYERL